MSRSGNSGQGQGRGQGGQGGRSGGQGGQGGRSGSQGGRSGGQGGRSGSQGGRSGGQGGRSGSEGGRSGGRSGGQGGRSGSQGGRSDGPKQGNRPGGQQGSGGNRPSSAGSGRPSSGAGGQSSGGPQRRGGRGGDSSRGRQSRSTKPKGLGGDQIEGRQAVRELLLAGNRRISEILMIEDMDAADILDDISELAFELKVPFRPINRKRMDQEALTHSHQGVIARAQPVPEVELETLVKKKNAFLLVLDGVTDPGNLGAILRTAECAGVTGIVLPRHRSVHISPTVTKTAAGAIEHLPMALVGGIPTAITQLKEMGVYTVGLDAGGTDTIFNLPIQDGRPIALVLGAEGSGLSRLVSERVDIVAGIPLVGRLNSLNVAMAGAVACFEVVRMRQAKGAGTA